MAEKTFPYRMVNVFFVSLNIKREMKMPDELEFPITIQSKLIEPEFPRLQINLRVFTPEDSPLVFDMELIGLFDYIGNEPEYDHDMNEKFLIERGFYLVYPYSGQLLRIITGQMGINPIDTPLPINVNFLADENSAAPEKD